MPHNPLTRANSQGALPARFRRPRLLIVGCGDIGLRTLPLTRHLTVRALTSSPERVADLRARGITPLTGDLDRPASLRRLAGLATHVLQLAPPPPQPAQQRRDPRSRALLQALRRGRRAMSPPALIYASTSGVYGDCAGLCIDETRTRAPRNARAWRRADAENAVRHYGRSSGARAAVLRIPGIYAPDRAGGTPRARLLRGTPVLRAEDDVYTNHIHADDLARALWRALWLAAPQRVYHASDNSQLRMGDYVDLAADLFRLPRPPRISRAEAEQQLPPQLLSFMRESRRLDNRRLTLELGLRLRYPTVTEGLRAG